MRLEDNRRKKESGSWRIIKNFVYFLPYSAFRGILRYLVCKEARSFLDVGCGTGEVMQVFNLHETEIYRVGVDIFRPSLERCHNSQTYDEVILCDIRHLPFRNKSFDVAFCVEVIEHLPKDDGCRLIEKLEELALKQVLLEFPTSTGPPEGRRWDRNVFQLHRSGWTFEEFRKEGYKVRGMMPKFPRAGYMCFYDLSYVLPSVLLVYFRPECANHVICMKSF
jgi:SAM-dependent methyltransferase